MSKDKYPSIFSSQMEATVFIILQIFNATSAVVKIGDALEYPPVLAGDIGSRDVFRPIARVRTDLMDYKKNIG